MSEFSLAEIADMSAVDSEQQHWLANYVLNSILRGHFESPARQQIFNFLRRTQSAFEEYEDARRATLEFLANRESYLTYLRAIGHWEGFLGYSWEAFLSLSRGERIWFTKGDGSILERVNLLHNRSKHTEKAIEAGQFLEETPLSVWLTNGGLACTDGGLTFIEATEVLQELARLASAAQDPETMREKLSAGAKSADS